MDETVSAVRLFRGSAPHLLGDDLPRFVEDLRKLRLDTTPTGRFVERLREIGVAVRRL